MTHDSPIAENDPISGIEMADVCNDERGQYGLPKELHKTRRAPYQRGTISDEDRVLSSARQIV